MTTTLEAVNEMLEWIQQPPAAALDTGGTSDEAEAETTLDRLNKRVQSWGWYVNEENDVTFYVSDVKIAVSGGAGTFTYGETVTESVTAATGTFQYLTGGYIYLTRASGTFTGGHTLTGGSSAATRTGAGYAAIAESKVPYGTDIIAVDRSGKGGEVARITQRNGFLWDAENNTNVFENDVHLDIVRLLSFTELPLKLATYITIEAALSFLKYKMPSRREGMEERRRDLLNARIAALQEDGDLRESNIHNTRSGREMLGDRRTFVEGVDQ